MEKLSFNYHTHTYRCGHASGSDEEYVLSSIELGLPVIGFSDHACFKDIEMPRIRMNWSQLDEYVSSINSLKEKYKDKIEIHVGFETEYSKEYISDFKKLLTSGKIEYLICGQHCYFENKKAVWYNSYHHSEIMMQKYTDDVIEAIKSGLFTYICHPDLIMNGYRYFDDFSIQCFKRIIEASIKYDCPLEINIGGLRQLVRRDPNDKYFANNLYPYGPFWDLVASYPNHKVVIGIDAHKPEQILDEMDKEAINFAKEHKLNIMTDLKLKKIK